MCNRQRTLSLSLSYSLENGCGTHITLCPSLSLSPPLSVSLPLSLSLFLFLSLSKPVQMTTSCGPAAQMQDHAASVRVSLSLSLTQFASA